jgi:HPt (histidine-containing phosphotransfer) domain-containing protein
MAIGAGDEIRSALDALRPEIRSMLAEDLPLDRQRAVAAYAASEWLALKEHAHRIKGSASFCRLEALKKACMHIEEQVVDGKPPTQQAMDKFLAEIGRIVSAFAG